MKLCPRCARAVDAVDHSCPFCGHTPQKLDGLLAFAPELAEEADGFEASYFGRLSKLEPGSFWFNARNELLTWALRSYFPNAGNFLEIGCGTGFVLSGIAKAHPNLVLSGSEVFSAGLSIAAKRVPKAELFQMDARRIPFADHFDVIGAFDVLEHIQEDQEVLSQMHQAVRPGGGILITVPQHPFLWSNSDDYAHHVRRYPARELERKVERAGFEVRRLTSFVSLLLPIMIAARWRQRHGGEFNASAEFELPALANKLLGAVMSVERLMIKAGLSFPAGGSLLLVGKRP
jgi:SAM-dependent methyltransferase